MHTGNSLARNIWLVAAVLWTVLIAVLSLVNFDAIPVPIKSGRVDKIVHVIFHFVFTLLWSRYLTSRTFAWRVFTSSAGYGILLELAQEFFTVNRHADIMDVLANLGGAAAGMLIYFFLFGKRKSTA